RIRYITVEVPILDTTADLIDLKSFETSATLDVLANDQDARQILSVDTTGLTGSVSISADGLSLVYDTGGAFNGLPIGESVTQSFTYRVLGWDGTEATETVTVTITGD